LESFKDTKPLGPKVATVVGLLISRLAADDLTGNKTSRQTKLRRALSAGDIDGLAPLVAEILEQHLREAIWCCLLISLL
jgi:hypothetical protein